MFQWAGFAFAMLEMAIIIRFTLAEEKVPLIPVCICSALALFFIVLSLTF